MRINSLDIEAYGKFTSKSIKFGSGPPKLHVFYGPNEAGKTTVKSAIGELLFGFHGRSPYGFKHGKGALLLRAVITNDAGATLAFGRLKKTKNDLVSPTNDPLPGPVLAPFVQGFTRDRFEQQFSLSRDSLIDGSRKIANGEGDVGASLYDAALGNASLSAIRKRLEDVRDDIYLSRGKKKLNHALTEFGAARTEMKKATIRPLAYEKLERERADLIEKIGVLETQIGELGVEIGLLTSLRATFPNFDRLLNARRALATVQGRPCLDDPDVKCVSGLLADLKEATADVERAQSRIQEANETLGTGEEHPLLPLGVEIAALHNRVGVYAKALLDSDGNNIRRKAMEHAMTAKRLLSEVWPHVDPEIASGHVISSETRFRGHALVLDFTAHKSALEAAAAAEAKASASIASAREDLATLPPRQDDSALAAAVSGAAVEGRIDELIATLGTTIATQLTKTESDLRRLGLFAGTLAELSVAVIPSRETVEKYATDFAGFQARQNRLDEQLAKARTNLVQAQRGLDALAKEGDLRTAEDLTASRTARDGIFGTLEGQWRAQRPIEDLDITAGIYSSARTAADDLADSLRLESARVSQVIMNEGQRDASTGEIEQTERDFDVLRGERAEFDRAWAATWAALGFAPQTPTEMRAWQVSAENICIRKNETTANTTARDALVERRATRAATLHAALQSLGQAPLVGEDLEPILDVARKQLLVFEEREGDRKRLADALRREERQFKSACNDREAASALLDGASADLGAIFEQLLLPKDFPPGEFPRAMVTIDAYQTAERDARMEESREARINADNDRFRVDIAAFCTAHDPSRVAAAAGAPNVVAEALMTDWTEAKAAYDRRQVRLEQLAGEKAKLKTASARVDEVEAAIEPIIAAVGINRGGLAGLLADSQAIHEYETTIQAETENVTTGIGKSIEECDTDYGGRARPEIDRALSTAQERTKTLRDEIDLLNPGRFALDGQIAAMDTSQAAADAESTLVNKGAVIDREARRYAAYAVAAHILEQQVTKYAEEHQGTLITRAGYYFDMVTDGAYPKLRPIQDDGKNVLHAVPRTGPDVAIDDLSEGTREQLYFALRLAVLEEYLAGNESQPLILDDTFIQFDDERTILAFKALAEFSKRTQVIYFAHHRACEAAANEAVPPEQLVLHYLDAEASGTVGGNSSVAATKNLAATIAI